MKHLNGWLTRCREQDSEISLTKGLLVCLKNMWIDRNIIINYSFEIPKTVNKVLKMNKRGICLFLSPVLPLLTIEISPLAKEIKEKWINLLKKDVCWKGGNSSTRPKRTRRVLQRKVRRHPLWSLLLRRNQLWRPPQNRRTRKKNRQALRRLRIQPWRLLLRRRKTQKEPSSRWKNRFPDQERAEKYVLRRHFMGRDWWPSSLIMSWKKSSSLKTLIITPYVMLLKMNMD